jgi:hypothetical protein
MLEFYSPRRFQTIFRRKLCDEDFYELEADEGTLLEILYLSLFRRDLTALQKNFRQ